MKWLILVLVLAGCKSEVKFRKAPKNVIDRAEVLCKDSGGLVMVNSGISSRLPWVAFCKYQEIVFKLEEL